MSLCVKITKITNSSLTKTAEAGTVNFLSVGMSLMTQGIQELNYSYEKEQEMVDCDNQVKNVDLLIEVLDGKKVGVVEEEDGFSFYAEDINCSVTNDAIKKIRQRYSKNVMLHEFRSKGYKKVKEEKLPNGSIRMVVERWE